MANTTLDIDVLDETEFATDEDLSFFDSDGPTDEDLAEIEAEALTKTKATKVRKPKAKPARKPKKVVEAETVEAEVTEEVKPERSGLFVGQNNFDRLRAEGKSSAESMWRALLTEGTVEVLYASEHAAVGGAAIVEEAEAALVAAKASKDKEAIEVAQKGLNKLYSRMANRITQRVQQPYQSWYPNEKAKGVFTSVTVHFKNGNPKSLEVGHVDSDRPPVLLRANGKPNVIGRLVLAMLDEGITEFECGVTDDMVAELVASVATETE